MAGGSEDQKVYVIKAEPVNRQFDRAKKLQGGAPVEVSQSDQPSDMLLVKHAKRGNRDAFAELVLLHLPRVLAISRRMLGGNVEAEDVAQDVMITVWKKLADYDEQRARFSTWISQITSNKTIDYLRRRKFDPLEDAELPALKPDQEQNIEQKQRSLAVRAGLQRLPERQRLALVLCHYEGFSLKEAGEIMDCSSEAIESLLARARRKLKQDLEPLWQTIKAGDL